MGKYNMTIGQVLGETARRFPGRPALIGEGFRCSYRELDEYSECAADRLWAQGVGRGAHVGVWANDQPAAFLCFCAADDFCDLLCDRRLPHAIILDGKLR